MKAFEKPEKRKYTYSMERDIFNILTLILAGLCVFAGIIYYAVLKCRSGVIFVNLLVCFVICIVVHVLNVKMYNRRLLAITIVMYIELVLMPVFMIFGVQMGSSTPIWFAGSIIGIILFTGQILYFRKRA